MVIAAEDELLGRAAAEQDRQLVHQLRARVEVAVLLREVQRVAERLAARDDRDPVRAVVARQQLGAQRVAGLVEGDHAPLVLVERAARLHAGHDALERVVEVGLLDPRAAVAGGGDRRLVGRCWPGRRRSGPEVWRAIFVEVDVLGQRLVARVHASRIASRPPTSGGETRIWRSKRPGRSSAGSSFSSRLDAAITTTSPVRGEAVHLDQQLVERLLALGVVVRAAHGADGVDLVDEDDRGRVLARLGEQAPDARGAEAGEHLDEARRRLREELRAGLVGDGLGQQRLAGAGRAVQQDALRHLRAELRGSAPGRVRKSTTSCSSALASSAPATSSHLIEPAESGLISCGLVLGIIRIIRQRKKTISAMKMIGNHSQDRCSFEIESQLIVGDASVVRRMRRRFDYGGLDPSSSRVLARRAGSPPARRGRPRAGARPARACRTRAAARSRASSAPCETGESAWRSLQAKTSTAAAVDASATAPPASGVGFSIARLSSSVPDEVGGDHRRHQVRAAALVLLRGVRARPRRRPRRRRSPCARRRGRRRAPRRAARTSPARARPAPRRARRGVPCTRRLISVPGERGARRRRRSRTGSRTPAWPRGSPRLTSGMTANASAEAHEPAQAGDVVELRSRAAWGRTRPSRSRRRRGSAAAQCDGPWTSRPLRRAMPPSRSLSSGTGKEPPGEVVEEGGGEAEVAHVDALVVRRASAARSRRPSGGAGGRSRRRRSPGTRRGTSGCR